LWYLGNVDPFTPDKFIVLAEMQVAREARSLSRRSAWCAGHGDAKLATQVQHIGHARAAILAEVMTGHNSQQRI